MIRRPVDILNASVVLLLLGLSILYAATGRLPGDWRPVVGFFVAMTAGLGVALGFVRIADRHWTFRLIADFYPIVLIPNVFNSLQPLITAMGFPNQDAALAAIDRALLGGHDATVLTAKLITPWFNDVMHLSYCTYYIFPIVVGVAMWRHSHAMGRRFIFIVVLAFYVSYAGYFLVPARGPRTYQWPIENVDTRTTPISRWIYDTLNEAEKTKDDVFPSGHNMITAVCLIGAWRFRRRIFWALLPIGLMLALSTVYCRLHYLIDVIAGVGFAFVSYPVACILYDRRVGFAHRPRSATDPCPIADP